MWHKIFETQDNHHTGRWQWGHRQRDSEKIDSHYPGWWMFGDAICAPPNMGNVVKERSRGAEAKRFLGSIGDPEDNEDGNDS
jgi:hypothetical protein